MEFSRVGLGYNLAYSFSYSFALSFALILVSCSSPLAKSKTDEKMRFQGSFSCQETSLEKADHQETVVEADVTRVRCARDEWKIEGEKVLYARTLFQSKKCENLIGRIEFTAPYQIIKEKLVILKPSCKLLRLSNGWIGENPNCMLNKLDLNTPYSVHSVFNCSPYVPKECQTNTNTISLESVEPTDGVHSAFDKILVKTSLEKQTMSCERYAGE